MLVSFKNETVSPNWSILIVLIIISKEKWQLAAESKRDSLKINIKILLKPNCLKKLLFIIKIFDITMQGRAEGGEETAEGP